MEREQPEIKYAHSNMPNTNYEKMIFMYIETMNAHFMHFYKKHKDKLDDIEWGNFLRDASYGFLFKMIQYRINGFKYPEGMLPVEIELMHKLHQGYTDKLIQETINPDDIKPQSTSNH